MTRVLLGQRDTLRAFSAQLQLGVVFHRRSGDEPDAIETLMAVRGHVEDALRDLEAALERTRH